MVQEVHKSTNKIKEVKQRKCKYVKAINMKQKMQRGRDYYIRESMKKRINKLNGPIIKQI